MHRPILSALAAVLTIAAIASPAGAETWTRASSTHVSTIGVNLDTPRGAEEMLTRIRFAAREVCDFQPGPRTLSERLATQRCVSDAVSQTVGAMHSPMLTAAYQGRDSYTFAAR